MTRFFRRFEMRKKTKNVIPISEEEPEKKPLGGCPRKTRVAESAHHCGGGAVR